MSISKIQETYKDIDKVRYEALSSSSRDEYLNDYDNLNLVLFNYCTKYLKIPLMSGRIPQLKSLDEKIVEEQTKNTPPGSLEILNYYFWDWESYTSPCSMIFDLLTPDGAAAIRIPNRIFEKIKVDIEPEFFINGIFGYEDGRDSINDEDYILPISCKYIGLWISRIKTKQIFVWTEPLFDFDEDEDSDDMKALDMFHQNFLNKTKRTPPDESYKQLIAGNPIFYPREKLINLEHLYYTLEYDSLAKLEFHNMKERKLKDISKDYANSAFESDILLNCFKVDDDGLVFDNAKFTKANKDSKSDILDFTKTPFYEELKKYQDGHWGISPRKNLASVDNFIIIETVDYEYSPLSYSIYHPSEWSWNEFKNWQAIEGELKVCALKINTDEVLLDYLLHFLRSKNGDMKLKLASFQQKYIFGVVEKDYSWKDISIPLPEIQDQKVIASALNKTKNMYDRIQTLETNLLTNPINAQEADAELKDMISRLEMISDVEKILQLIEKRGRENTTVELKQTLRLDIKTNNSEKHIETSALKTIPAFMNTDGGILLIGVSDDGEVTGMDHEIEQFHKDSQDHFKLWFGKLLDRRIGKEFINKIEFELVLVKEKYVLKVECSAITEGNGCYLDGKDFYVRRHAYSEKLEGSDLVIYSKEHFV